MYRQFSLYIDKYKEAGFEVSDYGNSCTKAAEFKSSDANKLTVYDTKGFFDAETERDNYLNGTKDQKLQLIKEIMQALESIQNTGVHGIFLVVKRGRIDVKDKEIIDNLGKYVFNDDMKKKVYLVFTNSSMKYCKNKQEGIGKNQNTKYVQLKEFFSVKLNYSCISRKFLEMQENSTSRIFPFPLSYFI